MTGFGRGVAEHARTRATVDVRAVNHRFLDLKLRGAPLAPATEEAIGTRVRGTIERGAVTVSVHFVRDGAGALRIDLAAARVAHAALAELATHLSMPGPALALPLSQPGVVSAASAGERTVGPAGPPALRAALAPREKVGANEGATRAKDILTPLPDP